MINLYQIKIKILLLIKLKQKYIVDQIIDQIYQVINVYTGSKSSILLLKDRKLISNCQKINDIFKINNQKCQNLSIYGTNISFFIDYQTHYQLYSLNIFHVINYKKILRISCGLEHTVIIYDYNILHHYGSNEQGQIDMEFDSNMKNNNNFINVFSGHFQSIQLNDQKNIFVKGKLYSSQEDLIDINNQINNDFKMRVKQVSCGQEHILILLENNSVIGLGCNLYGQLNISNKFNTNVQRIYCGQNHSAIINQNYNIDIFGSNERNQSIIPREIKKIKFVKASLGEFHTILLDQTGQMYGQGSNNQNQIKFDNF